MMSKLSTQDVSILKLMQKDASLSSQDIANQVHMSQSPCWRRINNLKDTGIIGKQVAILDRRKLGLHIVAFTTINLSVPGRNKLLEFEKEVRVFPEITEVYTMAGMWDYMLKIITRDIEHFEQFIREKLMTLSYIGEVHSHIAVTEIKNTTELPLNEL